jgi:hypothetical protein
MSDSTKTPAVTLLNAVSAADRARLEAMHSRVMALGAENHAVDATRELTGWFYELMKMPINGASPIADTKKAPDHSCMIGIHRDTAKAIADVIHTCAGGAINGSDDRLQELASRSLPALIWIIQWHLEEADRLEEEQRKWREAARGNAKGSTASH